MKTSKLALLLMALAVILIASPVFASLQRPVHHRASRLNRRFFAFDGVGLGAGEMG